MVATNPISRPRTHRQSYRNRLNDNAGFGIQVLLVVVYQGQASNLDDVTVAVFYLTVPLLLSGTLPCILLV